MILFLHLTGSDCCRYHRTGGFAFVDCKVDAFEPELHADPEELDGTMRDGMRRQERMMRG